MDVMCVTVLFGKVLNSNPHFPLSACFSPHSILPKGGETELLVCELLVGVCVFMCVFVYVFTLCLFTIRPNERKKDIERRKT